MTGVRRIDDHVHFRGGRQIYKGCDIERGLKLAESQGVYMVFDMPNTDPPIIRRVDVEKRLEMVPKGFEERYRLYIGATTDPSQLTEAMNCYDDFEQVIGIKAFFGSSYGPLLVGKPEEQRLLYITLARGGFEGVLAGHCEDEEIIQKNKCIWDPCHPISHSFARPKKAETKSVADQIRLAIGSGFKGTLHVCHVTCPETVDIINMSKSELKIACEVTPHHLLWDSEKMRPYPGGLLYKMNPPLRKVEDVIGLRRRVMGRKVDCIGTDHAPHALAEKFYPPHASGYPSLYEYQNLLELLRKEGTTEQLIDEMTHDNIVREFGLA